MSEEFTVKLKVLYHWDIHLTEIFYELICESSTVKQATNKVSPQWCEGLNFDFGLPQRAQQFNLKLKVVYQWDNHLRHISYLRIIYCQTNNQQSFYTMLSTI